MKNKCQAKDCDSNDANSYMVELPQNGGGVSRVRLLWCQRHFDEAMEALREEGVKIETRPPEDREN